MMFVSLILLLPSFLINATSVDTNQSNTPTTPLSLPDSQQVITLPQLTGTVSHAYTIPTCPHCPVGHNHIIILTQPTVPPKKKKSGSKRIYFLRMVMAAYNAYLEEKERQATEVDE